MRSLCSLSVVLALAWPTAAQERHALRYVEFRDGSILRLSVVDEPLSVTAITRGGRLEPTSVRPSEADPLVLSGSDEFGKKKQVLTAVQLLGSGHFRQREEGWRILTGMGAAVRPDLEACLQTTTDVEIRERLREMLAGLPPRQGGTGTPDAPFDRFGWEEPFWGFLGDQPIRVAVGGKVYPLTRRDVNQISSGSPREVPVTWQRPSISFRRITEEQFPPGTVAESFEADPTGRALNGGENVNETWLGQGLLLSTPVANSFVAVQGYQVTETTGQRAIANQAPARAGEVVFEFVRPGYAHIPAAVTHFGCWVGEASPGGATFLAYDAHGRLVGRVQSEGTNAEFVGFQSLVPVHKVRVVPFRSHFVLDGLKFVRADSPRPGLPDRFLVLRWGGDSGGQVFCKDVVFHDDGRCTLEGLPGGLPDLTLPAGHVTRVNCPRRPADSEPTGVMAQLDDGSVIRGEEPENPWGQPAFPRRPDLLKSRSGLVGLWGRRHGQRVPAGPGAGAAAWAGEGAGWQPISYVQLLEEVVLWKGPGGEFRSAGYRDLPPLWLARPAAAGEEQPQLRTARGETLMLSGANPVRGRLSEGVDVVWRGEPIRIPGEEIVSLVLASQN